MVSCGVTYCAWPFVFLGKEIILSVLNLNLSTSEYPCGLGLRPWSAAGHASASRLGTPAGTGVGKVVAGAGRLVGRAHNGAGRTVVRAREVRRSQFPARSPVPPAWLGIRTFPVFVFRRPVPAPAHWILSCFSGF